MKKGSLIKICVACIAVITAMCIARFVLGGPEDDWICSGGEWVMHGKPAAAKPTTLCRY